MSEHLAVCLIQSNLEWEQKAINLTNFENIIQQQSSPIDLYILPEMFSTGFTMNPKPVAEPMNGQTVQWMKQMAQKANAFIIGSVVIKEKDSFYNRMILASPDQEIKWYDKRHLFKMAGEHHQYEAGDQRLIFDVKGWKILPQVCYDLRFPVFSRNLNGDYDAAIFVANWPEKRVGAWKTLLEARAIENQAYVIGVNRIGQDQNGWNYVGASSLIDPMGEVLWRGKNEEATHYHLLDKKQIKTTREKLPFLKDGDDFELKL